MNVYIYISSLFFYFCQDECSFSKSHFVIVQVYSFSEFIIPLWLDLLLSIHTTDKFRNISFFTINLDLLNISVFLSESHWVYDLSCVLFFLVGHCVCCYQVSLFKCCQLLSMTSQDVMWYATLIEFYIFSIIIVLFLFQQILLGLFWDVID